MSIFFYTIFYFLYDIFIREGGEKMRRMYIEDCKKCPQFEKSIFNSINNDQYSLLNHSRVMHTYEKGNLIFREGNRPCGAYCIVHGSVKLYYLGDDGTEQIIRIAGPGEMLGLASLFSEEVYSHSAEALEPTTVCFLEKSVLLPLVVRNPTAALNSIRKLGLELIEAQRRIYNLATKSSDERLADLLLEFSSRYSRDGEFELPLSRKELAEYIGTAPETVTRLLTYLQDKKIIQISGRKIKILNKQKLLSLAGQGT